MKPTIPVSVFAAFLLATLPAFPNGGGYARGGVESTGTLTGFEPKGTENIRILDEHLTIRLGMDDADVKVVYRMKNQSGKRIKVRFGFPVKESSDGTMPTDDLNAVVPENIQKKLIHCQDYHAAAGGKTLKAKFEKEPNRKDPKFAGLAGWLVSKTTFAPGEEKQIVITYRSTYPRRSFSVSGRGSSAPKVFTYRLSTGACWAGTIQSGLVEILPNGVDPSWVRIIKPVNRFKKNGHSWVWKFQDLEPTLADDIVVEAVPTIEFMHAYRKIRGKWTMTHENYTVKASSTLPPDQHHSYYPAELNDSVRDNAWSEGAPGPGIGEWLEIRPKVAKPLTAIKMHPGYRETEELFQSNARPKRIKVILNGDHSFTADIPDKNAWCWIPVRNYDKPVKTIKIVFEDVWKGTHFEDMCVSEIALVAKLDKKPKLGPVR